MPGLARPLLRLARPLRAALLLAATLAVASPAQDAPWSAGTTALRGGRFTVLAAPAEARLARTLLEAALARDTFPGLPRPRAAVTIALAPDEATFRGWLGGAVPEWGAAVAVPARALVLMQGRDAGASAGDPAVTLRHELTHLALHEGVGPAIPRWFDEGYASYAAGEWGRDQVLATSLGLVWRGVPTLAGLDSAFRRGAGEAGRAYALAHHAVALLATLDPDRGLALLLDAWRAEGTLSRALRRAHGMTELDLERTWQRRVRRQYGVLALGADLTVISLVLVLLLGPLWWQRRQRNRRRLERLRAADAAEAERERRGALAALLGERTGDGSGTSEGPAEGAPRAH